MNIINLDHISANPLLPEVQEAMIDVIKNNYGNPSSQHKIGDRAVEALDKVRESVAGLIHCDVPKEVVFTANDCRPICSAASLMPSRVTPCLPM